MTKTFKPVQTITCPEQDCNNTYSHNPNFSSIKPARCRSCERSRKRNKQIDSNKSIPYNMRYGKLKRREQSKNKTKQKLHNQFPRNVSNVKDTARKKTNKTTKGKWCDKPTNEIIQYVQYRIVNPYIRLRDKQNHQNKCISCDTGHVEEAGHFYSIGSCPGMRLMVIDIHGQCHDCNQMKGGNEKSYHKGLIQRHGQKFVHELHKQHANYQKSTNKLLRHEIIEIAWTYLYLRKNKIWVFTMKEFEEYIPVANRNVKTA